MLLEQLVAHAEQLEGQVPPGYQEKAIRYIIDLDSSGRAIGMPTDMGSARERGLKLAVPHAKRASGIRPILFADYATYTLGIPREKDNPERAGKLLDAYRQLVARCLDATNEPAVAAVHRFLADLPESMPERPADFDPAANITFEVQGVRPIDLPSVRAFWAREIGGGDAGEETGAGQFECIVCGTEGRAALVHPLKIKGILAGQSGGTDLISANNDAYFSYGLERSLIAPTCPSCAEKYANGLNDLLANAETHIRVAGVEHCFWLRSGLNSGIVSLFDAPDSEDARRLYESLMRGRMTALLDADAEHDPKDAFYALSLSGNGARAVVLSWIDTTLEAAYDRIRQYFAAQAIVAPDGGDGTPFALRRLANAMVRDPQKQQPPRGDVAALVRFGLAGTPLPLDLLNQAVLRCRAEQGVRRDRAALIKMVLVSRNPGLYEGGRMERLDATNQTPAYLCGRLLAVLDSIQRQALGNPNTTIIDRFYGSASATPASVFGILLRGAQPHLAKLRKEKRAAYIALNERLETTLDGLKSFPKTLTLQDQGLFALGFYHQRAEDRQQARERREAREAANVDLPPDESGLDEE